MGVQNRRSRRKAYARAQRMCSCYGGSGFYLWPNWKFEILFDLFTHK